MSKNARRPQAQKPRLSRRQVERTQGLRSSNAAGFHKSKKAYSRKAKFDYWDD